MPPQILENIVILCFEKHFSNQNSVVRLKLSILAPPKFWAGYATGLNSSKAGSEKSDKFGDQKDIKFCVGKVHQFSRELILETSAFTEPFCTTTRL